MESTSKILEDFEDPDIFIAVKTSIEKEMSNLKKIVNNISQMRVEAAYLESDLVLTIDSSTWLQISDLIGLGTMNKMDIGIKEEQP